MKKITRNLIIAVLLFAVNQTYAQIDLPLPSPGSKVTQRLGLTDVEVNYYRPKKKGRDIFGGLEKFGTWWRIGANEATELLLLKDVTVNGTKLAAGRYSVHAKIEKDAWEIHFSTYPF